MISDQMYVDAHRNERVARIAADIKRREAEAALTPPCTCWDCQPPMDLGEFAP